jgi:DNA-binding NarL/FixJ family response regulator
VIPSSRRILIADDHAALREGVRTLLSNALGCCIVGEAADGREALSLALELQPDVVICDYAMPFLNGADLTRTLKTNLPGTEVLVFTMYDREEVIEQTLRSGARGYVLKSDSTANLIEAVRAVCAHKPWFSNDISQTLLDQLLKPKKCPAPISTLTSRERHVVQLIAEGRSSKEVANVLHCGLKTIETHRTNAMQKLNANCVADLVRFAVRNALVEP